jgi:hypothetical protein
MKMVVEKVYLWHHFVSTGGHQHCEQIPIKFDISNNMMAAFSSIENKLYQVSAESEKPVTYLTLTFGRRDQVCIFNAINCIRLHF